MKICLFGGSFDPVHSDHLTIAEAAQQSANLDKVIILPAACSPFKTGKTTLFSAEERMNLLHHATQDRPWAEVSDLSHKGFAFEAGALFSWKSLAFSLGFSSVSFRTAELVCGVGVKF